MAAKLSSGAGGGSSKWHVEANSEINVTPFVDIMLVLLIIFMVAAAIATVSVKVDLPNADAPPSPNPSKPVFLSIKDSGALYVGDFATSVDELPDDLKKLIGRRDPAKERIFIRGDKDTSYGDFAAVMTKLQDSGYYSVALVGEDHSGAS